MNWRDLPPLSALRAFCAYAEAGNLQKAGDALNVSHAAISQQIRNLETHLGLTLLDRSGRQAQLTRDGRTLADAAAAGFGTIAQAVQTLQRTEDARALVVSTTPSFAAQWLMPRLADFRAKYPQIDVIFDASAALVDMTRGEVDVAIRFGAGQWDGLTSWPLLPTRMIAVAAPDLLHGRSDVCLADLSRLPILQEIGTSEATIWLTRWGLRDAGSGGRVGLPGNLTLDAARAGQGIAVTADVWVAADLAAGRLVKLFGDDTQVAYHVVTRPAPHRTPLKSFVSWLRTQG